MTETEWFNDEYRRTWVLEIVAQLVAYHSDTCHDLIGECPACQAHELIRLAKKAR